VGGSDLRLNTSLGCFGSELEYVKYV
jgi:hypothetical protein